MSEDKDQRVYSIDRALEQEKPKIELRGELYEVADYTLDERLRITHELFKKQQKAEEQAEKAEEDFEEGKEISTHFEAVQDVVAASVKLLLQDVPDEVAENITEREYKLLQATVSKIREEPTDPNLQDMAKEIDSDGGKD